MKPTVAVKNFRQQFSVIFCESCENALIKGQKHFVTLFDKAPRLTRIDVEVPMDFFSR